MVREYFRSQTQRVAAVKPPRAQEYSVDVMARISKRGRMVYVTEVSMPVPTLKAAETLQKPFINAIVRAFKKRRQSKPVGEPK